MLDRVSEDIVKEIKANHRVNAYPGALKIVQKIYKASEEEMYYMSYEIQRFNKEWEKLPIEFEIIEDNAQEFTAQGN